MKSLILFVSLFCLISFGGYFGGGGGGGGGDFLADGSVPMTGNLDMGNNDIVNASSLEIDDGVNPAVTAEVQSTTSMRISDGSPTLGIESTVVGIDAAQNSTGNRTTVFGYRAGEDLTTAQDSVLIGARAGLNVTTGNGNVAIGYAAFDVGNPSGVESRRV